MAQREQLERIVGRENVTDSSEILLAYSKDESFEPPRMPSCLVRPDSAEEVQGIIHWAKEQGVPLTPVSSPGGPRFHGDTIPTQNGVIVDLSRMNRILNIDRKDRIAMIEPGVTFGELENALEEHGLRALQPLLPRRTKSALASYLEREPITIPREQWDASDPLACIEVIFGTGDMFRTGSAAGPGTIEEQLKAGLRQVNPSGPGSTSLAKVVQGAQGTMGIATWATVFCSVIPQIETLYFIPSNDLGTLIELAYRVLRLRLGEQLFVLNSFYLATIVAEKTGEMINLMSELPPWILIIDLAGREYFPEEHLQYQDMDLQEVARSLHLELKSSLNGVSTMAMQKILRDPPKEYFKLRVRGGCQEIFFVTTLDRSPGFVCQMNSIEARAGYAPVEHLGVYVQPTVQGCACHCEFLLPYDPTSPESRETTKRLLIDASGALADSGAFFSRPYGQWATLAYSKDAESTAALKKVKGIFDPRNIMNPGKLCF
jgi:FAD/FMN-containing dehydrogenase